MLVAVYSITFDFRGKLLFGAVLHLLCNQHATSRLASLYMYVSSNLCKGSILNSRMLHIDLAVHVAVSNLSLSMVSVDPICAGTWP